MPQYIQNATESIVETVISTAETYDNNDVFELLVLVFFIICSIVVVNKGSSWAKRFFRSRNPKGLYQIWKDTPVTGQKKLE